MLVGVFVMYERHVTGKAGEDKAVDYLINQGYTILERNWSRRIGEIDIIARKDNVIYFFEVKTRSGLKYGHPFAAISRHKRYIIMRLGSAYVANHKLSYRALSVGAIGIMHDQIIVLPSIDS